MSHQPAYSSLSPKEFNRRITKAYCLLEECRLCPHLCGVKRKEGQLGRCRCGLLPMVSSFNAHHGEEPPISGCRGSGAIFFTNCNLRCCFCQNYPISQLGNGREAPVAELAGMMLKLQKQGCHNINLVTPTPQTPQILKSLSIAIELGLKIPLVYNTSSYDSVEVLKLLDGVIDIYMPDTKYADDKIAFEYSNTPKYFEIMKKAIKEMHRQVGDLTLDEEGIAQKGLLIRHLVLPNDLAGSDKIFEFLAKEISPNSFLNIMDQYHPCHQALEFPELSRRITRKELQKAILLAKENNLTRLYQR